MFYKYLTKQNQLLGIRPAGPAPDLKYFRNKVSNFLNFHVFFRPNAGLHFLYSRGFYQTSVADRLFSFIF